MTAYVANTNTIDLTGLKNAATGAFINDASVSVTVKDSSGASVTGVTWPVVMEYVASSSGVYRGVIASTANLLPGRNYTAEITVEAGVDSVGFWAFEFQATSRRD